MIATTNNPILKEMLVQRDEVDAAHERAARTALLEHARMGRSDR